MKIRDSYICSETIKSHVSHRKTKRVNNFIQYWRTCRMCKSERNSVVKNLFQLLKNTTITKNYYYISNVTHVTVLLHFRAIPKCKNNQ